MFVFLSNKKTKKFNQTYKDRMLSLEHFVLVKFILDAHVVPVETQWFGFYRPKQSKEIYKMEQSELYTKVCSNQNTMYRFQSTYFNNNN